MAEYHFVSTWQIQVPPDGVGKQLRLLFRTRLPYTLGFDVRVTRVQPPSRLEARASGELDGTGCWTLTSVDGGTLVRYDWDVRTTSGWMNLLAPAARPLFSWNHDELMREGGQGLARRLGVAIALPDAPSPRHRPGNAAQWVAAGAVLTTLAVTGRRWHISSR